MRWGLGVANPHYDFSHRLARLGGQDAGEAIGDISVLHGGGRTRLHRPYQWVLNKSTYIRVEFRTQDNDKGGKQKTPLMLYEQHEGRLVIIVIMGRHPLYHHD
jgi:hypothetical protein